jgi:hypothetical protein
MHRLAAHEGQPHDELAAALEVLAPDALTVFSGPMAGHSEAWRSDGNRMLSELRLPTIPASEPPADGRDHSQPADSFTWLWGEFTSVARLEEDAEW